MARKCGKCKTEKPDEDFPKSKATKSGFDYKCKECHRAGWHARNPRKFEIYAYPHDFVVSQASLKMIFDLHEGALTWKVNTPSARIGDVAGTKESGRPSRVFVNGQRWRVEDLKAIWLTGEIPKRENPEPRNRVFEREWMREIRSHRKGFDWSSVWKAELARRRTRESYYRMEAGERRDHWRRKAAIRCPKKRAETNRRWKINNPEANKAANKRAAKKHRRNPRHKPKFNLRRRFKDLMDKVKRGGSNSFSKTIGCTTIQLSQWLQGQFIKGMTWGNYGTHWHVDHIIPVAAFDHTIPEQVRQCWHYTNLRPLGAEENMAKSDTITEPQMPLALPYV